MDDKPKNSNRVQPLTLPLTQNWASKTILFLMIFVIARLLAFRVEAYRAFGSFVEIEGADLTSQGASAISYGLSQIPQLAVGIGNDVIVSALLGLVSLAFPRKMTVGVGVVLALFLAANVEHIKYNFGHIDPRMMHIGLDPTFVSASLSADVMKYALLILAVGFSVCFLVSFQTLRRWLTIPTAGLVLISLPAATLVDPNETMWLQTNPVINVTAALPHEIDLAAPPAQALMHTPVPPLVKSDGYNVLVLYLEGLSYDSINADRTPALNHFGQTGTRFENYFSRQIITANGLYATLTGDTPSFFRDFPRWNAIEAEQVTTDISLPKTFGSAGYKTAFVQASPLTFMQKDTRLTALGFSTVKGQDELGASLPTGMWGIDDSNLMDIVLEEIDRLPSESPWFLSVLTVGTHAPYFVPDIAEPSRLDALRAVDISVSDLIGSLGQRGVLRDTIVVITSDEGREPNFTQGFWGDLRMNRLPLIVLHPDLEPQAIDRPLLNTDLPGLLIHFAGNTSANTLRPMDLPDHEHIVFGNVITKQVFWFDASSETLTGCITDSFRCLRWSQMSTVGEAPRTPPKLVYMPEFESLLRSHDTQNPWATGQVSQ